MHPVHHAQTTPDKPAFIMAGSGLAVSYATLEERSNRIAQLLRQQGCQRGDSIAIFLENNPRFFEICWAAQRAGLYFTAISSRLTTDEVAYIADDCDAKVFFTSRALAPVAAGLPAKLAKVGAFYMMDGETPAGYQSYEDAQARMPARRIADECAGRDMLYSSGTTGRPKGVKAALPAVAFDQLEGPNIAAALYGLNQNSVYLSPAPLYHSAPLRFTMGTHRIGGTVIVMEHFDAAGALEAIERYQVTHSQWVPTMFVRMLKLPEAERRRHDLSSLQCAVHAAAPCPIPVKRQMIEWWGPILHEYYAGTEGNGFCAINSQEWLAHPGSVGRPLVGKVHICDEEGREVPQGEEGTIYFEGGATFEYHKDATKTAQSRHPQGWSTLGDIGKLDPEGYLYLTDRKAFMIISGGVNIYPQELENLLIGHPKVADVAVIGVPNEEFGEEVKAVVQPMVWSDAGPDLAAELMAYARARLSPLKCPRSVDFERELPRHPTGKLYKRLIRDRYWGNRDSRIV